MLEFDKVYPYVRVYFNHRNDAPKVWSVDDGNQANELNVAEVITEGIGLFKYSGEVKNDLYPVAWIEYPQAEIRQAGDVLIVTNSE